MAHSKQNIKQIKLYGYQQIAFDKIVVALKKTGRALMVMATGLGKTIMSIEVVKYFITPKDTVLFLCHDNGILNKTYKDYKKFIGDSYTYAKFYGDGKDWEADKHHFVFATFQSVLAHLRNEKAKKKLFSPKHFTFIVVDESHHSQAETFAEVINYFKPKYKLGMTATPDREDQADIRDIFGEEVVNLGLAEAIAKGWLTPIEYKILSDGLDEEKIRAVCKEVLEGNVRLTEKQINEKIFIKVRTEEQCKIIQSYSKTRKAIVFCENIEHLQHVASILPSAVTIHSEQTPKVNDFNFDLFEQGHVQHVIVVDKFNEGIDIPNTELLNFLRNTGSERIFLQQLGRGLRKVPGKEKVIILDFVANVDRIKQVSKLVAEIERLTGIERAKSGNKTLEESLHVEGKGFSFDFSNQIVNLLAVFERLDQDFYPTWQEAHSALKTLNISGRRQYQRQYREDRRLHSAPEKFYKDFPGWDVYLLGQEKSIYSTWEQASEVCQKLGITGREMYSKRYKEDKRLPSNLSQYYKDYPGSKVFFSQRYLTWQEASRSAQSLGITSFKIYQEKYKQDLKLPGVPSEWYKNFPGYNVFFGKEIVEKYKTWELASKAAIALGIKDQQDYSKNYKKDPKLPCSSACKNYKDFPGFRVFLRGIELYKTWQEASSSVVKLGINSQGDYWQKRKKDPKLPGSPRKFYSDFPGWPKFLGKK